MKTTFLSWEYEDVWIQKEKKKSCQLFIEIKRIWITYSVFIVTNWHKHQKLVKEVFMLHVTVAIYNTKHYIISSYFFEVKSITLQNTAICLKEIEGASSVWQCRRKVQADSNTAKGMRLTRFLMGKLHFF